jgi:ABC-type transporter Mla subunit MlaD
MPKRISDIGKQLAEAASGQGTRLDVTLENFEELIQDLKDYMEEVKGA